MTLLRTRGLRLSYGADPLFDGVDFDLAPGERVALVGTTGGSASYLLDVLGVMTTEQVRLILSDANSSALVQEAGNDDSSYVVMPMRL